MLDLIIKGGWVMWPIILGSVIGLAVVLERFWVFIFANADSSEFIRQVFRNLKTRNIDKALDLCEKSSLPIAAIFKIGVERCDLELGRLEKILEQAGNNQVQKLEKHLGALASVITIEPLLGFLGTITGLISAFMTWEKAGANVTVNSLASGIYQAMITTAAGLIVSIPLLVCYNYFISRIKYFGNSLTNYSLQLLEILGEMREGR